MFSESIVECTIDTLSLRTFMQGLPGKLVSSEKFGLYQTELHRKRFLKLLFLAYENLVMSFSSCVHFFDKVCNLSKSFGNASINSPFIF